METLHWIAATPPSANARGAISQAYQGKRRDPNDNIAPPR